MPGSSVNQLSVSGYTRRNQPVDATPFQSNPARWNDMHIEGMHGHVSR